MTDIKQFVDWYAWMDNEGGLEGIVRHGHHGTGDAGLDNILEELQATLDEADSRINEIHIVFKKEIDDEYKRLGLE